MKFALALAIALHFWGDRGVHVPCAPVPVPGANVIMGRNRWGSTNAMEATNDCRVLMSSDVASATFRAHAPEWYCGYVAHEVGHMGGLSHSATGVMAPEMFWDDIPWECVHWRYAAKRYGIKLNRPRSNRS